MKKHPRVLATALFVATATSSVAGGQAVPVWRVSERPRVVLGGSDSDFHRVSGAAFLPGNQLVVADAGNSRLLFFSAQGVLQRRVGRAGSGPGEFELLGSLAAFGDTVLTYDLGLKRVSLWIGGSLAETIPIPFYSGREVVFQAALSARQFLAVTLEPFRPRSSGLFIDTVSVLRYDAGAKRFASLGRREWRYLYLYPQQEGHTTYRTPFLPSSHVLAATGKAVFIPLTGAAAQISGLNASDSAAVALPIPRVPFDRAIVASYRDSLLKQMGSGGPASTRLREVFGDRFPAPPHAPRIRRAAAVGSNVWIEAERGANRLATWYVVSPAEGRLVGQISLPRAWQVLAGDLSSVIVLQKDELDVESIAVYDIQRHGS